MLKRVLVLDDNKDILDVVHEALSYEQFEVICTSESEKVIPLLGNFNPDLVILDYRVAGENGGQICRRIKADPQFSNIPVIIFSAYFSPNDQIMAYGCDAVINKPFDLVESI